LPALPRTVRRRRGGRAWAPRVGGRLLRGRAGAGGMAVRPPGHLRRATSPQAAGFRGRRGGLPPTYTERVARLIAFAAVLALLVAGCGDETTIINNRNTTTVAPPPTTAE